MMQKVSYLYAGLTAVLLCLLVAACGDTAVPTSGVAVPAATTAAATTATSATTAAMTTAAGTTATMTTAAMTTSSATTAAMTTSSATTSIATTAAMTTVAGTTRAATTAAATTTATGATTAASGSAAVNTGYVLSSNGESNAKTFTVQNSDKIEISFFTPNAQGANAAQGFAAGGKYPLILVSRPSNHDTQAIFAWHPDDESSWDTLPIDSILTKVQGIGTTNQAIMAGDTFKVSKQPADNGGIDVTFDIYRGNSAVATFSFVVKGKTVAATATTAAAGATTATAGATTAAATTAAAGKPVAVGSVVNIKSATAALGYLDSRGYVKDEPHFSDTNATSLVQTATDPNRDRGSGTWKIESASGKADGSLIENGDKIYLKNCYQSPVGYLALGKAISADDLKLLSGLRSGYTGGSYLFTSLNAKTANEISTEFLIVTTQSDKTISSTTPVVIASRPGAAPAELLEVFDWQKVKGVLANAGQYGTSEAGFVFTSTYDGTNANSASTWNLLPSTTTCS